MYPRSRWPQAVPSRFLTTEPAAAPSWAQPQLNDMVHTADHDNWVSTPRPPSPPRPSPTQPPPPQPTAQVPPSLARDVQPPHLPSLSPSPPPSPSPQPASPLPLMPSPTSTLSLPLPPPPPSPSPQPASPLPLMPPPPSTLPLPLPLQPPHLQLLLPLPLAGSLETLPAAAAAAATEAWPALRSVPSLHPVAGWSDHAQLSPAAAAAEESQAQDEPPPAPAAGGGSDDECIEDDGDDAALVYAVSPPRSGEAAAPFPERASSASLEQPLPLSLLPFVRTNPAFSGSLPQTPNTLTELPTVQLQ